MFLGSLLSHSVFSTHLDKRHENLEARTTFRIQVVGTNPKSSQTGGRNTHDWLVVWNIGLVWDNDS